MSDSRGACWENSVSAVILQRDDAERNSTLCNEGRGSLDGSQFNYASTHVFHIALLLVPVRYVNDAETDEDLSLQK